MRSGIAAAIACPDKQDDSYYLSKQAIETVAAPGETHFPFSMRAPVSRLLATAGFESLACGVPQEAYRAITAPAWSTRPVRIVEVRKRGTNWLITGAELTSADGRSPHVVSRRASVSLPDDNDVVSTIQTAVLWREPLREVVPADDAGAVLMELRSGSTYRVSLRVAAHRDATSVAIGKWEHAVFGPRLSPQTPQ